MRFSSITNSLKITAITVLLLAQIACGGEKVAEDSGIVHTVIIWLKEPGNVAQRQALINASQELAQLSLVQSIKVGTVIKSDREVVDDSYDVALTMHFADAEALAAYENHPQHKEAVNTVLRPLAKKVVVYDFELARLAQ